MGNLIWTFYFLGVSSENYNCRYDCRGHGTIKGEVGFITGAVLPKDVKISFDKEEQKTWFKVKDINHTKFLIKHNSIIQQTVGLKLMESEYSKYYTGFISLVGKFHQASASMPNDLNSVLIKNGNYIKVYYNPKFEGPYDIYYKNKGLIGKIRACKNESFSSTLEWLLFRKERDELNNKFEKLIKDIKNSISSHNYLK